MVDLRKFASSTYVYVLTPDKRVIASGRVAWHTNTKGGVPVNVAGVGTTRIDSSQLERHPQTNWGSNVAHN